MTRRPAPSLEDLSRDLEALADDLRQRGHVTEDRPELAGRIIAARHDASRAGLPEAADALQRAGSAFLTFDHAAAAREIDAARAALTGAAV